MDGGVPLWGKKDQPLQRDRPVAGVGVPHTNFIRNILHSKSNIWPAGRTASEVGSNAVRSAQSTMVSSSFHYVVYPENLVFHSFKGEHLSNTGW